MPHDKKWLRIHTTQEWHDLYQPSTNQELSVFFDRYCKGIENNWDETPKVRVSLLGYNMPNIIHRPVESWPVPGTEYKKLFLGSKERLLESTPTESTTIQYQADIPVYQMDTDPEESYFRYTFSEKSYLLGAPKAVMFMSCNDADDLDVFFQVRKEDASGTLLRYYNIPENDMLANGLAQKDIPLLNTLVYLDRMGRSELAIARSMKSYQHPTTSDMNISFRKRSN